MAWISINFESKALGMPVMTNVLMPQGRGGYKTLYLLHGAGGDYASWLLKSRVADYAEGKNIAVVMPSGNNKCYVNNRYGKDYFTFPDVSDLKNVYCDDLEELKCCSNLNNPNECINNLKSCGVGYRAPYMKKASEIFTLEMDLEDISKMSYDEAFDTILKVPGVGPKVADCILLYGFNFRQAFPSDVWIKRIVSYLYFDGNDVNISKIREFGMEEFGDYAGYVQLYLFHYARMSGLMKKLKGK